MNPIRASPPARTNSSAPTPSIGSAQTQDANLTSSFSILLRSRNANPNAPTPSAPTPASPNSASNISTPTAFSSPAPVPPMSPPTNSSLPSAPRPLNPFALSPNSPPPGILPTIPQPSKRPSI